MKAVCPGSVQLPQITVGQFPFYDLLDDNCDKYH